MYKNVTEHCTEVDCCVKVVFVGKYLLYLRDGPVSACARECVCAPVRARARVCVCERDTKRLS